VKEILVKFHAARGKEMSHDKGSDDVTSKAERKQKSESDASPVDFCRRSLAEGKVWDSLADLLQNMNLLEVGTDDKKEVRKFCNTSLQISLSLHEVSNIANIQQRTSITCFFSSLTKCF